MADPHRNTDMLTLSIDLKQLRELILALCLLLERLGKVIHPLCIALLIADN